MSEVSTNNNNNVSALLNTFIKELGGRINNYMSYLMTEVGYTSDQFVMLTDYWYDSNKEALECIMVPSIAPNNEWNANRAIETFKRMELQVIVPSDASMAVGNGYRLWISALMNQMANESPFPSARSQVADTVKQLHKMTINSDLLMTPALAPFLCECIIARTALAQLLRSKASPLAVSGDIQITETLEFITGLTPTLAYTITHNQPHLTEK